MGYAARAEQKFSRRFFRGVEKAPEREPPVEAMWKGRIVHRESLTQFLIFCKRLSSRHYLLGVQPQRLGP
jgi:hypothetical protein